jgi:hypothetical protein
VPSTRRIYKDTPSGNCARKRGSGPLTAMYQGNCLIIRLIADIRSPGRAHPGCSFQHVHRIGLCDMLPSPVGGAGSSIGRANSQEQIGLL